MLRDQRRRRGFQSFAIHRGTDPHHADRLEGAAFGHRLFLEPHGLLRRGQRIPRSGIRQWTMDQSVDHRIDALHRPVGDEVMPCLVDTLPRSRDGLVEQADVQRKEATHGGIVEEVFPIAGLEVRRIAIEASFDRQVDVPRDISACLGSRRERHLEQRMMR
ncbi:hypothetical protein KCV01_g12206, partial [Aureobasidium melanogenum]